MPPLLVRGGIDVEGLRRDVLVADGRIAPVQSAPSDVDVLDAAGLVVSPGLVDLQVNGAAGVDVTAAPERLWEVAAELARHGVTAFLPTVVTGPPGAAQRAGAALRRGRPDDVRAGAVPLGLHLEGPMLAASHRGAHPERWLAPPSLALVDGWSPQAGVRLVTLAPELPGALEVIGTLVSRGVVVSIGHTAATLADVRAAVDAGATVVTHLFNAMPALHHREPGPVGAALGGDDLVAAVIVDGHHVDPLVVHATWRALGPDRFLLVSDGTAALGMPDGEQLLGESVVRVADGAVRLPDGTLAGSAASLRDCLQVLLRTTGCSLAEALAAATSTPAALLGDHDRGTLDVGTRGDLVLLDHDVATASVRVVATVVAGEVVHDGREL
jgi:N-acetylglucosamine-6-phosphate deacetylase